MPRALCLLWRLALGSFIPTESSPAPGCFPVHPVPPSREHPLPLGWQKGDKALIGARSLIGRRGCCLQAGAEGTHNTWDWGGV